MRRRLRPARRRPVDMVDLLVLAQRAMRRAMLEEILQLRKGRAFRRAEQARDGEGAAGIGPGAAGLERLVAQIAAQEAGHEGVAGAQHVIDLDREARALDAVLERVRDRAGKDDAAHRAALADDGGGAEAADGADRRQRVLRAAGRVQLLLGADDQVAIGQDLLEMPGHGLGADIALLAGGMPGQAPEIGPVVDVEDDLAAMRCGRSGSPCSARRRRRAWRNACR